MSQTSGSSPVPSYSICESCGQSHNFDKNHVYDYPDEIEDELLCQICCQPLVDPVDTPCSHTFCYTCLRDHLKQKKSCPIDSSPVRNRDVRPASILVRRLLDKLTVVCPNNAYCDDTMQRCALEVHLKYQCGGSYVSCPRMPMGCEYRGPRCELEEHLWMCPYGEDKDEDGELLQIRDNEYCLLEIPKGTAELGLRVIPVPELKGGGVTVDQIFPEGVAAKDNRLRLGDRIVEINDVDITQKTFAQACLALGGTTPLLKLVIYRQSVDESVSSDTGSESDQIVLTRKNGQNLGIQIMTRKGRTGVFVCGLLPNSAAMDCGKISIGDQIIEVNGVDMRQATVDEAADIMASSSQVSLVLSKKSSSKGSSLRSLAHVYDEIQTPSGLLVGQEKHVIINKKPYESFGMSIAGGKGPSCGDMPVYINDLISDGIVALTKQIQRGDILLALNEVSLVGKTHSEAVQIIKSMPAAGTIHFHLIQGDAVEGNPNCLSPDWPDMPKTAKKKAVKRKAVHTWPYAKGFKPPSRKESNAAIGDTSKQVHLEAPENIFLPVPAPTCEDDWLAMYNEEGQTFQSFMEGTPWLSTRRRRYTHQKFVSSGTNLPSKYPDGVIYLLPMGDFEKCNIHPEFDDLAAYTRTYIGLPVEILPQVDLEFSVKAGTVYWTGCSKNHGGSLLDEEGDEMKKNYSKRTKLNARFHKSSGTWQLNVDTVLTKLRNILPGKALCLLALTMIDLYCDDTDLFVAGMSAENRGVAVFSFARYDPALCFSTEFWYEIYFSETIPLEDRKTLLLQRSCRLLVHEIGHLLGVDHCIFFQCCMNGSGHLAEDFSQPMSLCPVDLHKLEALCGFSVLQRYKDLQAFYKKHGFKEEEDWVTNRIMYITKKK